MEGVRPGGGIPESLIEKRENVYIFQKASNGPSNDGRIEILEYKKNNNWRDPITYFGPETGIGHYVSEAGHRIAIVKYAYGGSKMVFAGTPSPQGYWQTNATSALNHYPILVSNWADQALDAFKKAGFKPYISAFIWCQGETDAHDPDAAHQYKAKLTELLDNFKAAMAPKDSNVNNMRVIITRTRKGYPLSNTIREAQQDIADSYHNAYLIDSDEWALEPDGIHFTAQAQAMMHGKAIADILVRVIP